MVPSTNIRRLVGLRILQRLHRSIVGWNKVLRHEMVNGFREISKTIERKNGIYG